MFDVTPDEIAQLNDVHLRELIGRLCEAEVTSRGLSPVGITWGGNQTAADGGLDVRVALPAGTVIDGFIPCFSVGFQVKTPDMPRACILTEMRPAGAIRPVIQELADEAGAYIIVSSHGSTADTALRNRRIAMRDALVGADNVGALYTDFYDRTRVATWVRRHPGLITWVKEKVGHALAGWRPYGPWSGPGERVDAEYLVDNKLRLDLGKHNEAAQPVTEAIDDLRDVLAQPRKMVRLVGLSGVGKTRLVQALFDPIVGSRPLPQSLAVYTNLSDNPDPQPMGLASDLIANRTRAVLIVDNCPPDLHRRLSDVCAASGSTLSVITIEYDVRDDQPEGTHVVTLDTSSPELIEKLILRRYLHLSEVDARTIAEASGGNARIAIALAGTVERSDTIAGLSDDELFQRLFRQRHDSNDALLIAAQACSLVYSFQGEALTSDEAELPRLALLADQSPRELYRHVGELLRRDLVQQRSIWRAVLPHAVANRLAARALEDIPYDLIDQQLVTGGADRLAKSFSRRLAFLHEHPSAVAIVERWLAPGGLLADVSTLDDLGQAMLENVAPVSPEATLEALERAGSVDVQVAVVVWGRHQSLLRSLSYEPPLFERSAALLARTATQSEKERDAKEAAEAFTSLFTIYLSGTHATIEQRLALIERLLRSGELKQRSLGLAALGAVLEATHFSSGHRFEFGARSRDYGYRPQSDDDVDRWYGSALSLIERLALTDRLFTPELRDLLAQKFRGLWASAHMDDELEALALRFARDDFWRDGWVACRQTMRFDQDQLTPESLSQLTALEAQLRPTSLAERVRALVLSHRLGGPDLDDMDDDIASALERREVVARELGAAVATDDVVFSELLPEILRGGGRAWAFGRGLAHASENRPAIWTRLVEGLDQLPPEERRVQVHSGFLSELWAHDEDLVQRLLDAALDQPALMVFLPVLHSPAMLDLRGIERLKRGLEAGRVPVRMYSNLAFGGTTAELPGEALRELLLHIAGQPDGFEVAVEILAMRFHSDRSSQREHAPELCEVGRQLLSLVSFKKGNRRDDDELARIARVCLADPEAELLAAEIAGRLRQAVATYATNAFANDDLLNELLTAHPMAVLDALLDGNEREQRAGIRLFDRKRRHQPNPRGELSPELLVAWCDRKPETRYPVAASIVALTSRPGGSAPLDWSEQAKTLIVRAPDPGAVLAVFVRRFRPTAWSGSLAPLLEANARLLDVLPANISTEYRAAVADAKAKLATEIANTRRYEVEEDRERDERFE